VRSRATDAVHERLPRAPVTDVLRQCEKIYDCGR
jgi:hypothetical protein